jgi:hypothetical protein
MSSRQRQRSKASELPHQEPVGPTYQTVSYVVYPSGYAKIEHPAKERWCLSVIDAGNGWAVRRGAKCLNIALQWEDERPPLLCDSQFIHRCRYNEHAALLRARRVVDRLEVDGLTFDDFVALVGTTSAGSQTSMHSVPRHG